MQGIGFRIGPAVDLDLGGLEFHGLALGRRGGKPAADPHRAAGGEAEDILLISGQALFGNDLEVGHAGAVIDLEKGKILAVAAGADPAAYFHCLAEGLCFQELGDAGILAHGQ